MGEKKKKRKEQKEERTHCMNVGRERIAHNIKVARHDALPSKAIRDIGIDRLREMWRINRLTSSKSPLLQFLTLVVATNQERKERRRIRV